jgi:protein disulfide-isomerase A6
MKSFILFSCIVLAAASFDGNTDVLNLDGSNFDQHVGGSKPAFVEFYAPWCGHCKSLAPEYEKVATAFKHQPVVVAAVDADKHRELGSRFEVSGFPTLKYFPAGSTTAEVYSGGRSAKDIVNFINGKAGTNARIKEAPTAVTVLTEASFDSVVKDPNKNVLVEFYAPWCGHCKKLAPDYEKLAKIFSSEKDVVIANLDATEHHAPAEAYGVSGYPTIKWFPKDNKEGVSYEGGRSVEDFVKYINEHAGTERTAEGGWLDTAGRIPDLDTITSTFMGDPAKRHALLAEAEAKAKSIAHKAKEYAKYYTMAMKKIIEKGEEFGAQEVARLERMVGSGSVAKEKLGEFAKRINIAKLFKREKNES